ncbi:winged helix-turn-helix domain-containing protein [Aerococcus viridans]
MNTDWKKLKLSSSGLPTWDSFIPYILQILVNGEEATRKVIVDRVLDYLRLPDDLRSKLYSKSESGQSILANRIGFALADLYKANAIT